MQHAMPRGLDKPAQLKHVRYLYFPYKVSEDEAEVSSVLCDIVADKAKKSIAKHGAFTLAIPGGSVAKALGGLVDKDIEWSKVHVFFVNERCPDQKNYKLAQVSFSKPMLLFPCDIAIAIPKNSRCKTCKTWKQSVDGQNPVSGSHTPYYYCQHDQPSKGMCMLTLCIELLQNCVCCGLVSRMLLQSVFADTVSLPLEQVRCCIKPYPQIPGS